MSWRWSRMKQISFSQFVGIDQSALSHVERWVAAVGAFCGILVTAWISKHYLSTAATWLMVGSMGASAVLLFAVPHGQLSQPWAATVGQVLSATVGVTCAKYIPDPSLAAASAVSLAILVMHYTRCIHPPAGATALIAVIGGPSIQTLGYRYVLDPVMINTVTIIVMALAFNNLFRWRRYPAFMQSHTKPLEKRSQIRMEDIKFALEQIDSPIDAIDEDLLEIVEYANSHASFRFNNQIQVSTRKNGDPDANH